MKRQLEQERLLAWRFLREGSDSIDGMPEPDESVEIKVSADMQWLKPGRAHNAPNGYAVAMGSRTRKVVAAEYRTKVGVLKNHTGSSGRRW